METEKSDPGITVSQDDVMTTKQAVFAYAAFTTGVAFTLASFIGLAGQSFSFFLDAIRTIAVTLLIVLGGNASALNTNPFKKSLLVLSVVCLVAPIILCVLAVSWQREGVLPLQHVPVQDDGTVFHQIDRAQCLKPHLTCRNLPAGIEVDENLLVGTLKVSQLPASSWCWLTCEGNWIDYQLFGFRVAAPVYFAQSRAEPAPPTRDDDKGKKEERLVKSVGKPSVPQPSPATSASHEQTSEEGGEWAGEMVTFMRREDVVKRTWQSMHMPRTPVFITVTLISQVVVLGLFWVVKMRLPREYQFIAAALCLLLEAGLAAPVQLLTAVCLGVLSLIVIALGGLQLLKMNRKQLLKELKKQK